jgi:hypothetical protein
MTDPYVIIQMALIYVIPNMLLFAIRSSAPSTAAWFPKASMADAEGARFLVD